MTHLNDTMSTSLLTTHKKNAHLTKEERVMIATLKSQGLSNRAIGRQLGVNHQTINNELNRGAVRQLRRIRVPVTALFCAVQNAAVVYITKG